MKFLLSVVAIIAVATALPTKRSLVSPIPAGPAILVDENNIPIQIGDDFINGADDFAPIVMPQPDGGAVSAPVETAPVATPSSAPLVQIIVNVNAPAPGGVVDPVQVIDNTPVVDPIQIVDVMPVVDPIQIIDTPAVLEPVQIVDVMPVVDPVQIVDVMPVVDPIQIVDVMPVVEPVQIGAPIIPAVIHH